MKKLKLCRKIKLRWRIISLAILILLGTLYLIADNVSSQAFVLERQQQKIIEAAYLASKEVELKNYIALARSSIADLYDSGQTDASAMKEAKAILTKLRYGEGSDGYFFVYDFEGKCLVHQRKPELVGTNQWVLKDPKGKLVIQDLIDRARQGKDGGFEDYYWQKPSNPNAGPKSKRAYVIALDNWGWMLGTGVYLDDIDLALKEVNSQMQDNIHSTRSHMIYITFGGIAAVLMVGLVLNINERRLGQEKERKRVARELHDGICQELASVKYQTEASITNLAGTPEQFARAQMALKHVPAKLSDILDEVRRIMENLHPAILRDLGLEASLRQLTRDFKTSPSAIAIPTKIKFSASGKTKDLYEDARTALYRIAQEALNNIQRHANAHQVYMRLESNSCWVTLTIRDYGVGINGSSKYGSGIRNIRERVEEVGGKSTVNSSLQGTEVIAIVPRDKQY